MNLRFFSDAVARQEGLPLLSEARDAVARLGDGSALALLEVMVDDLSEARTWYWSVIGDVRRLALAVSIFDDSESHRERWERVTGRLRSIEEANGDEPTLLHWWGGHGAQGAVA